MLEKISGIHMLKFHFYSAIENTEKNVNLLKNILSAFSVFQVLRNFRTLSSFK